MKQLVILIIGAVSLLNCYSQEKIKYENVVQTPGISKTELYNRAKEWFALNFNTKEVIQSEDKEEGVIIGRAIIPFNPKLIYAAYEGIIYYNLKIQVKDGRYKYSFTDFIHEMRSQSIKQCDFGLLTTSIEYDGNCNCATKSVRNKVYNDLKENVKNYTEGLSGILEKSMAKKPDDNNW